jgi:hypothetical protein
MVPYAQSRPTSYIKDQYGYSLGYSAAYGDYASTIARYYSNSELGSRDYSRIGGFYFSVMGCSRW